jgi:hypothetical protein
MKKAVNLAAKEKYAQDVAYRARTWINLLKVCTRPALKAEEINSLSLENFDRLTSMAQDITLNRYPILKPLFEAIEVKCSEDPILVKMANTEG